MRKTALIISFFLLTSAIFISDIEARPSMAFGYLTNNSKDQNYNYLETIFPNSFASSLKNIFDVEVFKPHTINAILAKYNLSLKKIYEPYEIPELIKKLKADIFIYGNFTPISHDRIKIVLNYYSKGSKSMFTFTNIGKMETEIFKLVDRITQILINYMDKRNIFQSKIIKSGSGIAIISNISGEELNNLYFPFMERGYNLISLQGNYLYNLSGDRNFNSFKYIHTEDNSFDLITAKGRLKFLYGSWAGKNYHKKLKLIKNIYRKYDSNYSETKKTFFEKIEKAYNNRIDNLLIIGINKKKKNAWVRCIDLKEKKLIWLQKDIKGKNITDIANNIINNMSAKITSPLLQKAE